LGSGHGRLPWLAR